MKMFKHVLKIEENSRGSEHLISGASFCVEVQLVHYRDIFDNYISATKSGVEESTLNIAIFFKLQNFANAALDPLLRSLDAVTVAQTESEFTLFPLANLLPTR